MFLSKRMANRIQQMQAQPQTPAPRPRRGLFGQPTARIANLAQVLGAGLRDIGSGPGEGGHLDGVMAQMRAKRKEAERAALIGSLGLKPEIAAVASLEGLGPALEMRQQNLAFDYRKSRDQAADQQADQAFRYQQTRDQVSDAQADAALDFRKSRADADDAHRDRAFHRGAHESDRDFGLRAAGHQLDAAKAAADAAEAARVDPKAEMQFAREWMGASKDFVKVRDAYARIQSTISRTESGDVDPTAMTPAGQMSLVFQFMKMLDPGSTVREGEYANAENARGVASGIANLYNDVINGKFLTPSQVADFAAQADKLYEAQLGGYDDLFKKRRSAATDYGYDPERAVPDLAQRGDVAPLAQGETIDDLLRLYGEDG